MSHLETNTIRGVLDLLGQTLVFRFLCTFLFVRLLRRIRSVKQRIRSIARLPFPFQ